MLQPAPVQSNPELGIGRTIPQSGAAVAVCNRVKIDLAVAFFTRDR
jgi:hypothetical protein